MMNKVNAKTCLFVDIGGVLLTDGWNHASRKLAADEFALNYEEMEKRHNQAFDTYELGKISLEEYLSWVVFCEDRTFTASQFREFMFAQSNPYQGMLELVPRLKNRYSLKIVVVSNEGRELNAHRIQKYRLDSFVDSFISSSFVRMRKPDKDIFRLALDTAQVTPGEVVYIENTPMYYHIAAELGIQGILHTDYTLTCEKLTGFGLQVDE